jgi:predicted N-acetyltransferase YhbS
MHPEITYLPDSTIDADIDRQIRALLTTCFTKAEDDIFHHRRFFKEPYPNRWVIHDDRPALVAHIGVHEKEIQTSGKTHRFGGIAEVCVHPDYRGKGYVKAMLAIVHPWLAKRGFEFAVLFGDPDIYGSSGYTEVDNLTMDVDPELPDSPREPVTAMVLALGKAAWPEGEVYLPGPHF